MNKRDKAIGYFSAKMHCSQSVLAAFSEECGIYLLGYDISTPEGRQKARNEGLFTEFCPKMVASAVDILEEIIEEMEHDRSIKC